MLVDSHCHLDQLDFQNVHQDLAQVVANAKHNGVQHMLCVGITLDEFPKMLDLVRPFAEIFAACGVHPSHVTDGYCLQQLKTLASDEKVIAIGETGLDYFHQHEQQQKLAQQQSFSEHIALARELNKPLIVHTRMAREDTLAILKEQDAAKIGGVLHCFTENYEMAKAAIDLGFYISISGIVTFNKAAELKEVVRRLPLSHLLIETDSPYLAPMPYRGKQNQPAYVKEIANYIALLKGVAVEEVAQATTENFFNLFQRATR